LPVREADDPITAGPTEPKIDGLLVERFPGAVPAAILVRDENDGKDGILGAPTTALTIGLSLPARSNGGDCNEGARGLRLCETAAAAAVTLALGRDCDKLGADVPATGVIDPKLLSSETLSRLNSRLVGTFERLSML